MNDRILKRMKLLNWLLLVPIAYLGAEFFAYESSRRAAAFFELTGYGGNAWRAGYWASIAAILVLVVQFVLGFVKVLRKREGGKVCYILFYAMLFLMLLVQNLWYPDTWLRYIPVVIVLLISGFQGEYAKKLCTAQTSRVR